jgi:hypothetical protein
VLRRGKLSATNEENMGTISYVGVRDAAEPAASTTAAAAAAATATESSESSADSAAV